MITGESKLPGLEVVEVTYPDNPHVQAAAKLLADGFELASNRLPIRIRDQFQRNIFLEYVDGYRSVQAIANDDLVGIGSVMIPKVPARRFATLEAVVVRPDYQRRGVGAAVISLLEKIALENDVPGVVLQPRVSARPFYAALGYERGDSGKLYKAFDPLYSTF